MISGLFGIVSMKIEFGRCQCSYPPDHIEEHAGCSHCLQRGYKVSFHQAENQQSPLPAHPSPCQRASFCMAPPVLPEIVSAVSFVETHIKAYRVSSKPQPFQRISNKTHACTFQLLDNADVALHINKRHR